MLLALCMLPSLWNICFSVSASCQRPCDSYHMQLLGQRGHWPTLPLRKLCLIGKLANYKLSLISFVIVITCSCCGRGGIGPLCHNSYNYCYRIKDWFWFCFVAAWRLAERSRDFTWDLTQREYSFPYSHSVRYITLIFQKFHIRLQNF